MESRRRVRTVEDLLVWQMGIELVPRVYVLTAVFNHRKQLTMPQAGTSD